MTASPYALLIGVGRENAAAPSPLMETWAKAPQTPRQKKPSPFFEGEGLEGVFFLISPSPYPLPAGEGKRTPFVDESRSIAAASIV